MGVLDCWELVLCCGAARERMRVVERRRAVGVAVVVAMATGVRVATRAERRSVLLMLAAAIVVWGTLEKGGGAKPRYGTVWLVNVMATKRGFAFTFAGLGRLCCQGLALTHSAGLGWAGLSWAGLLHLYIFSSERGE